MKKIMVIAAVALAAVCSKAASVNWNIANVQSPTPGVIASAGWLVEVYQSSVTYTYAAAKAGTITAANSSTTFASGTIMRVGGTIVDGYSANDAVELYAVVYDAATVADAQNYIVSAVPANKKIAASGADLTLAFGNMAATTTANMFYGKSWTATGSTPVPEPTSGLLMLLGLAGLALKRKRA